MKFYSDLTQKLYETAEECQKAEQAFNFEKEQKAKAEKEKRLAEKKKQEERATDAKKVEALREEMVKAQANYRKAVEAFVEKHGSYHFSTNSSEKIPYLFGSLFDILNL